ncbi:threonine-phosphate decarboxylase CobD [uncultured Phascolarctobacterium sp.]|uniref:threonine-phosphate decarboxylase CobD n=1 Tax=uncultured Phascolarctobacterium sp. TaxID=512296 RepID=UPI0025FE6D85|nr:threonine-phosphate decarboxylase CobD [uncultured Phascolarctobacterium sp.]
MYKSVHGGDIYSEQNKALGSNLVDYSANVNPLGLPASVKDAVKNAIKNCVNYPDPLCRELAEKLAHHLKVRKDYLFISNGAADVLFKLALAAKPKRAVLLAPTFADYEKALQTVGCKFTYYDLREGDNFVIGPDLLKKINSRVDMVVICNPNNPTGKLMDKALLEELLEKCSRTGTKLLVDECFMDFVDDEKAYSLRPKLNKYPNLIILKAFTKTYAMPGMRLGYCITSDAGLIRALHENGQDWNVSVLAQAAGIAALDEASYLFASKELIRTERQYLTAQLEALGAKTFGSEANYIFFKLEKPANLAELLHKQGFLIRECANYHNLDSAYYRIAVKTRYTNRALIKAIKEVRRNAFVIGNY